MKIKTIKIKTMSLSGVALDWAVAMCEMPHLVWDKTIGIHWASHQITIPELKDNFYCPHASWAIAGPIIEREKISIAPNLDGTCNAEFEHLRAGGDTALEATMRCYVLSKLGEEVNVPKDI